ncbi:class II 3-deoxy-7-phosphoheptulonate synthase [Boudabousia marimammalium]|uniref:Phospho-2-dehydro-3-deoxyheptonate aldolase n=1 Tax=Boudabousia marimammalium TaxID=156892 RepID=A0A1Q5PQX1_9ACTO|nr:3-deoxy-7-phosphoheptulonate synthase class II [Boudabousia marimammalium]OKL49936.1 3-deoxy-7-phosphoheptulonate synthase [Boudabousia marimammalium]
MDAQTFAKLNEWRNYPAQQQPSYADKRLLREITEDLRTRPPLVFAGEVDQLTRKLAAAAAGQAFVLTGGDCAETFADSTADKIRAKVQTILQMSLVMSYGASMPIVKMGRIAGQYSKPRSAPQESKDGITLPSYRGDAVNGFAFTHQSRQPDPRRLLEMYQRSATSLNLIRAFTQGGYADLRQVHLWNQGFRNNPAFSKYETIASELDRALRFMTAVGADFDSIKTVDFYSAHESLLLEYESAMTRVDSRTGKLYDTSAHYLWIGERTRDPESAHVKQAMQIANPIGVKIGPNTSPQDLLRLIDLLNPEGVPGRLSFITRMGVGNIRKVLPGLVKAVEETGNPVVWISDPMHGNTITSVSGYKTRRFSDILGEVEGFFQAVREAGGIPGGIHIELTGDDVTEVMGGSQDVSDDALAERYETLVDPRLNHQQSLELAFLLTQYLAV